MNVLRDEPFDEAGFEAVYEQYFGFLVQVAVHKFQVPDFDAEALAHDVLLSYLRNAATIVVLRPWLVGAICFASRHYWRQNGRFLLDDGEYDFDRIDPSTATVLDTLPDRIAVREAIECLEPRCQRVLYMRYFEGCTVPEIAAHLGVKSKAAAKLISRCLRRGQKLLTERNQRAKQLRKSEP
jgi:RNA polymerase sigma factor (sigma-70 family)